MCYGEVVIIIWFIYIYAVGGNEVEAVMVDEVPFPPQITITKPLSLLAHGKQSHVFKTLFLCCIPIVIYEIKR